VLFGCEVPRRGMPTDIIAKWVCGSQRSVVELTGDVRTDRLSGQTRRE